MKALAYAALLIVLLPGSVGAIALGKLELNSGLNQQLDARIELVSVATGEAEELRAVLADAAAFERVGLARPDVLRQLRFKIVTDGGSTYIAVTSKDSIREPSLTFIIELDAPAGTILRQYSVLLETRG